MPKPDTSDDPALDVPVETLLRDSLLYSAKIYLQDQNVETATVSESMDDDLWLEVTVTLRKGPL
ncbi:hypothetical protein [Luteolibacter soli]|uniref:Uncharacterized protein n=1 Tax=Luteolibacter soli TaxID=3135280 RepID=A0ABU9AZV3_9BACT